MSCRYNRPTQGLISDPQPSHSGTEKNQWRHDTILGTKIDYLGTTDGHSDTRLQHRLVFHAADLSMTAETIPGTLPEIQVIKNTATDHALTPSQCASVRTADTVLNHQPPFSCDECSHLHIGGTTKLSHPNILCRTDKLSELSMSAEHGTSHLLPFKFHHRSAVCTTHTVTAKSCYVKIHSLLCVVFFNTYMIPFP